MIECLESRIAPATFLVTSLLDDLSGGTLREAIDMANANPLTADTITFAPAVTGKILIDPVKNAIRIEGPLTIKGPGVDKLTVSGAGTTRAFFIDDGDAGRLSPVSISNLGIIGGSGGTNGGGIVDFEPLTLTNVTITGGSVNQQGGGLHVDTAGKVTITGCKFLDNKAGNGGGGLTVAAASVTISKTTIALNELTGAGNAGGGGANVLTTAGPLKISNSVVAYNVSTSVGGGLLVSVLGGQTGIVEKTTLIDNEAATRGGGLYLISGNLTLSGAVVQHNSAASGGGMSTNPTGSRTIIAKSIFSGNVATSAADLGGGGICYRSSDALAITGSQFLGNRSALDGGAFTLPGGADATVSGSVFTGNSADDGGGAIGISPGTLLTLKGDTFLANEAPSYGGAIYSRGGGSIAITGGSFRHNVSGDGGAIAIEAQVGDTFNATGVLFQQNSADGKGGGIFFFDDCAATIKGSKFIENNATSRGGGIAVENTGNVVSIAGSLFRGNSSDSSGGGISHERTNALTVSSTIFLDNSAYLDGGGLYIHGAGAEGPVVLTKLKVTGNISTGSGGGIFSNSASATLTASTVTGNFASADPNTSGI